MDGTWRPTFTNATYYFVDQEYRHWKRYADNNDSVHPMFDAAVVFSDSVRPVVDAGLATFVEPSAHLAPEVALIPSHGHTPGHVSVLIESKGESAVITGDLMHTPCQIGRPDWSCAYDTDQDGRRNYPAGLPGTLRGHLDDGHRHPFRHTEWLPRAPRRLRLPALACGLVVPAGITSV